MRDKPKKPRVMVRRLKPRRRNLDDDEDRYEDALAAGCEDTQRESGK